MAGRVRMRARRGRWWWRLLRRRRLRSLRAALLHGRRLPVTPEDVAAGRGMAAEMMADSGVWLLLCGRRPTLHGQTGKKPRRGLLRTLLCCFSRQASSKSSKASTGNDGRCSPPVSPGSPNFLLPSVRHSDMHKKCMVIDLDETLVHSSFKPINNADFVVPVEIDGTVHQVYVLKRPYVDEFLQRMGELYECVLFTASLAKYADPVADLLDRWGVFRSRLFRESCVFHRGNYVKDLNKLGRDLQKVVIVDNSPASYIFHPDNAVPVASWFDDMTDSELLDLIPFFEKLSKVDNVYTVLCNSNHPYNTSAPSTVPSPLSNQQPQQQQQQQQLHSLQVNNHTQLNVGS